MMPTASSALPGHVDYAAIVGGGSGPPRQGPFARVRGRRERARGEAGASQRGMGSMLHRLLALGFALVIGWTPVLAQEEEGTGAYQVKPGDVLLVSVWKEPDLQGEVLVRPDGGFSFPLAGEVDARGRTVAQLQEELAGRIEKFIPDPVVTVAIRQVQGNKMYVIGKVNRPGEFVMSGTVDVMQALSIAGGTTPFAALNDIHILRREEGLQRSIPFRYGEIEKGRGLIQNILLESGDIVVVP